MASNDFRNTYPTLPHDDSCIRLLKMIDDEEGVMEAFELERAPVYIALSYSWFEETDKPDQSCTITINEQATAVAYNLWSFLHHQRYRIRGIYIWVDAICIDQNNVGCNSSSMIGEETEETNVLFDCLEIEPKSTFDVSDMKRDRPESRTAIYQALETILHRKYWSRVWILQETFLAKDLQICCGSRQMSSDMLHEICELPFSGSVPFSSIFFAGANLKFNEHFDGLHSTNILKERGQFRKSKAIWFTTFEDIYPRLAPKRLCSDPRDHVFAFLSLCSDADLRADYTLTNQQVFRSTFSRLQVKRTVRLARALADPLSQKIDVISDTTPFLSTLEPIYVRAWSTFFSHRIELANWGDSAEDYTYLSICPCDVNHDLSTLSSEYNKCGLTGIGCLTSNSVKPTDQAYWIADTPHIIFVESSRTLKDTDGTQQSFAITRGPSGRKLVDVGVIVSLKDRYPNIPSQWQLLGVFAPPDPPSEIQDRRDRGVDVQGIIDRLSEVRKMLKVSNVRDSVDPWSVEMEVDGSSLSCLIRTHVSDISTVDFKSIDIRLHNRTFDRRFDGVEEWGKTRYSKDSDCCRCRNCTPYGGETSRCERCGRPKNWQNPNQFQKLKHTIPSG